MKKSEIRTMIKEEIQKLNEANLSDNELHNIVRWIPAGSLVVSTFAGKNLKIVLTDHVSAPPLVTKDIKSVERHQSKAVENFIDEAKKFINISKSSIHPYIHMKGEKGRILFTSEFSLDVKTKPELQKLEQLVKDLKFYNKLKG